MLSNSDSGESFFALETNIGTGVNQAVGNGGFEAIVVIEKVTLDTFATSVIVHLLVTMGNLELGWNEETNVVL